MRAIALRGLWLLAVVGTARAEPGPSQTQDISSASMCDSIDSVPVTFTIDYQSAIQGIFNANCVACHTNTAPPLPAGLSLDPGVSWSAIVNHASSQRPGLVRVVPNRPDLSLLFHKVNCAVPDVGARMPYGGPYLSIQDQALIHDWIAGGAPSGTTDTIFRSGFEIRD
ncbi:hypothetical protein [Dokdonella soli]|uniref:Cytochrome c domain-containing protein n=1 Tax=Dokdonella soli TaxID=529810 RepID=A0ABP3THW0_9GAMM